MAASIEAPPRPKSHAFRQSKQPLAPAAPVHGDAKYSLYPTFPIPPHSVQRGFDALAGALAGHQFVRIDGYSGVLWIEFQRELQYHLEQQGIQANWLDLSKALKPREEIESIIRPYLGGDDPLFGTRIQAKLIDLYDETALKQITSSIDVSPSIVFGFGAALVAGTGPLVYVDVPKNEIQFRSRAGSVWNLGTNEGATAQEQYKRFYFVDWPLLNRHKAKIVEQVDWFVDAQRPEEPTFIAGDILRDALDRMSRNVFRVRPWFEPGPWGGQWLKRQLPALPQDEPNYAWSFELIVPENGILFSDGRYQCEVSFDWLMYYRHREVLGDSATRFGFDFPIRFDFLDTMEGGNLSLQCHPRPDYIREHFGEPFTQDETYYIVDCGDDAEVFLGFQANVNRAEFRGALEHSLETSEPIDVERFVQALPAKRHDLFLIPSGTIHCSGANNLVLEISATPYVFTFKMYDWLRLGMDGKPRPLNIARAFDNLRFDRQGSRVVDELVSKPSLIDSGADWKLIHLPTHEEHFYDVHRFDFATEVTATTDGSPHVLMVVEGSTLEVVTEQGMRQTFNFIETFVVPAAAGGYRLINRSSGPVKVIQAFLKPSRKPNVGAP